jgi:hypothetical protein
MRNIEAVFAKCGGQDLSHRLSGAMHERSIDAYILPFHTRSMDLRNVLTITS